MSTDVAEVTAAVGRNRRRRRSRNGVCCPGARCTLSAVLAEMANTTAALLILVLRFMPLLRLVVLRASAADGQGST